MNKHRRILLLEDDQLVSWAIKDFLENSGFDVVLHADRISGVQSLMNRPYDAAIVDLNLKNEVGGGERFILEAKKIQPDLPVLIHTAESHFRPNEQLSQLGIRPQDICVKADFDLVALRERILKLVVTGIRSVS